MLTRKKHFPAYSPVVDHQSLSFLCHMSRVLKRKTHLSTWHKYCNLYFGPMLVLVKIKFIPNGPSELLLNQCPIKGSAHCTTFYNFTIPCQTTNSEEPTIQNVSTGLLRSGTLQKGYTVTVNLIQLYLPLKSQQVH